MTDEEKKAEAIEWAKRQPNFPKAKDWVMKLYEKSKRPPFAIDKLTELFGSYNNFRREAGAKVIRHNSAEPVTLDVLKQDCKEELVSKKPEIETPCWIWQKATDRDGYAKKAIGKKNWQVHIYVHEVLSNNPKPEPKKNYTVDHLCKVTSCINPEHLRWATWEEQAKNRTRGKKPKHLINPPRNHSCLEERLNWYKSQCEVDDNGCWIPPKLPRTGGYLQIGYDGKYYQLHILSALQKDKHPLNREYYESFTPHHMVLHKCPVSKPDKRCCNPDHLEIWDREEANRQNALDTRGYHSGYKLKHEDIPEIREMYNNYIELDWNKMKIYSHIGSIYGVHPQTIATAVSGIKSWTDIE